MDLDELEKAYNSAMQGTGTPSLGVWRCEECNKAFFFPRDTPCEHLQKFSDPKYILGPRKEIALPSNVLNGKDVL